MDDTYIITVFVVFDELCQTLLPAPKYRPKMVPAEILTVAVVAARYFGNHLERALLVMAQAGYIPKTRCLSVSRFNRQLHRYGDFLELCLETLLELSQTGEAFIIDSMPVPVCKRSRAAPLPQSARAGVLRLLRRQKREVLRLAPASDLIGYIQNQL